MAGPPAEAKPPAAEPGAWRTAIEELVRNIRGVAGCRAVLDASGELVELHVVSTGERPPKLIIRDIQSLLLVRLNLTVPHRKVSVAVVRETSLAGRGRQMREQAPEYVVMQQPASPEREPVAEATRWEAAASEAAGAAGQQRAGEWPSGGPGLVLREVAVRYEGTQLQVRVELTSFGRHLSATVTGPDEGVMPALLGARAVMEALAADPAWRDVHLQWVDVAGVAASPAAVVSVARGRAGQAPGGGPATVECVGARPERGNLTLAAAAATVDALVKLLPMDTAAL